MTHRDQVPLPVIPALTPLHSKLSPGEATAQHIVMSSPWIDLGSEDPVVAELSRQAFNLEIAYIAFCGVQNVVIPGPNLTHGEMCVEGFSRFARAIREAFGCFQLHKLSDSLANGAWIVEKHIRIADQDGKPLHIRGSKGRQTAPCRRGVGFLGGMELGKKRMQLQPKALRW